MFRRLWQAALIRMARNDGLKQWMQRTASSTELATRYVGASDANGASRKAKELCDAGIHSSLFYLGEYVDTMELVDLNVANILAAARACGNLRLDVNVSIDPTQIGFSIDRQLGWQNAYKVAEEIQQASQDNEDGTHSLMLDMEDFTVAADTIALHDALRQDGFPVALTLQAYLHRTPEDIAAKIRQGAKVRLVKGAFSAGADIALTTHSDIDDAYWRISKLMLSREAHDHGFYPIFGTHDHTLHQHILEQARLEGWKPHEYEIEMLYGARPDVAAGLSSAGHRVRLYLPFGEDWWPYAVRRIAENPRSALLLARALLPDTGKPVPAKT